MRATIILALLCIAGPPAFAQAPDPAPYPPPPPMQPAQPSPPQPYPPQGYAPPPQGHVPVQLSTEDHELLLRGEISPNLQIGGAVANAFLGFGIGQAIQGRWSETGWIFTLGMGGSIALMIGGAVRAVDCDFDARCNNDGPVGAIVAGAIGITVFYFWGIIDAVTGPASHNRRVRDLRMRLGIPQPMWSRVVPYVNKTRDGGGTAGLLLRF